LNAYIIFRAAYRALINMVCDKALLAAYVTETGRLTLPLVEKGIKELEGLNMSIIQEALSKSRGPVKNPRRTRPQRR